MARRIKRLQAEPVVVEDLRRRSRATTSMVRERGGPRLFSTA